MESIALSHFNSNIWVCNILILLNITHTFSEIQCTDPPRVENTTVLPDPYLTGRKANYRCYHGYEHFAGELVKSCSSSGEWVGENPVCLCK